MATFVLAWNPTRWAWGPNEFNQTVIATAMGARVPGRWSVGGRRGGIDVGDRAFLLRQHSDRGIVASAHFTSGIVWDDHWDGSGRATTYADLEWDVVVDPIDRLAVDLLKGPRARDPMGPHSGLRRRCGRPVRRTARGAVG